MKSVLIAAALITVSFHDYSSLSGTYVGTKEDYFTEIKLYDDSVFAYKATREFPFEVSDGKWLINGDTVILNSEPCANPELLQHPPVRTYKMFTKAKYLVKGNSLIPVSSSGKLQRGESLFRQN
ncbi:MAG: hypothetical protein RL007_1654 [Bacteroidota bacterium]|jgi:hypothetical protein